MDGQDLVRWLAEHVRESAPLGVATLTPAGDALAVRGCGEDDDFEIGSISKAVTGMLYFDALARGEVRGDQRLGEWLDLRGSDAAAVTLSSLSTHSSGLPRLQKGLALSGSLEMLVHGRNPYVATLPELLEQTAATAVGKPKPAYSNLGYQVLGHALAAASGQTYAELVRTRVAAPLDLDPFYVPATPEELRPGALPGVSRRGKARDPWADAGLGPAGGIRASTRAMSRFGRAILDRRAPGLGALDPVAKFGGARIGAAWLTMDLRGTEVTWHNGGTGGFRSVIFLDRRAGRGVVVLRARSVTVDALGMRLMQRLGE